MYDRGSEAVGSIITDEQNATDEKWNRNRKAQDKMQNASVLY
jgi:hypothetical protein